MKEQSTPSDYSFCQSPTPLRHGRAHPAVHHRTKRVLDGTLEDNELLYCVKYAHIGQEQKEIIDYNSNIYTRNPRIVVYDTIDDKLSTSTGEHQLPIRRLSSNLSTSSVTKSPSSVVTFNHLGVI